MPLRDNLLNPIPGDNPSGASLRYAPVYDKIKEARREEDDAPQGDWQRERKIADFNQVIKLAGDALANQTKDLQLAAWLTEAMLKKEGFAGLRQCLDLLRGLIENYWDTLYPEAEDGDLELRSAPLEWVGTRLVDVVKTTPLTRGGYGFYRYKQSRTVGYEADATQSDRQEARQIAVQDGKLTAEEFDKDYAGTPTAFYEKLAEAMDGCLASVEALNDLANQKFGDVAPSFGPLREALEEVRHSSSGLLQKRLEQEGRAGGPAAPAAEEGTYVEEAAAESAVTAATPARHRRAVTGIEPQDVDDAAARLAAVAKFLRQQDACSPAPYLLLRGYRWGELRGLGESPDPMALVAPATEVRQTLKRLAYEANWSELIQAAETAMAEPCGRAWLDLQRYVARACDESGYHAIATAIKSELKALLADLPKLPEWSLADDTPTANAETQAWLKDFAHAAPAAPFSPPMEEEEPSQIAPGEPQLPDTYTLALEAARSGRVSEAIEMLAQDIPRQYSGRSRFQRKLQLAQVCMMTGHEKLAEPILEELAHTIEVHRLEDWEASDVVAHPLAMLYRCLSKLQGDAEVKQKLYARISRLDPVQALQCTR